MLKRAWLLLPLPVLPAAWLLLGADWLSFLSWWLALSLIGWLAWPLAARLFPDGDCGYLLAKPLGLALASFLLWTLSYCHLVPFRRWAIVLILGGLGLAAWLLRSGWKHLAGLTAPTAESGLLRRVCCGELFFAVVLLIWTFARGLKPELDSLEKFMDVGFMNTLWRTEWLPARDMWLSGSNINYYYYGQYAYTFVAKFVNIRPEVSYNLSLASTFALTLTLAYAVVSRLMALARRHDPRLPAGVPTVGGLLAAVLVGLAGNGHAFLYDPASPGHAAALWLKSLGLLGGDLQKGYWFADSTRFIGYNPETADKTIHEFPYYSFLVADLHAHLINLAFMLLLLALLVRLIERADLRDAAAACSQDHLRQEPPDDRTWHRRELQQALRRLRITAANGPLLLTGLLLAIAMMGNYWDFAIYLVVASVVLYLINCRGCGRLGSPGGLVIFLIQGALLLLPYLLVSQPLLAVAVFGIMVLVSSYLTIVRGDALTLTGAQMAWLFFLAHLLTLPFNSTFDPIAKSIALAVAHTPLWQLLVLWGPHLLAGLLLLVFLLIWGQPGRLRPVFPPAPQDRAAAVMPGGWLTRFVRLQNPADLLACALLICGAGLILAPELLYVVDIYSGDYKRTNTMFKFTYQAFVLLSLVWAYAAVRIPALGLGRRGHSAAGTKAGSSRRLRRRPSSPAGQALPIALIGVPLIILLLIPLWYPLAATGQWLGTFQVERYRGLDGLRPLADKDSAHISGQMSGELAADYAAINWLNRQVSGQPVILEASGESYTDYCRISAFTGLPTVIGWETHEWLWRTGKATPNAYSTVVYPRQEAVRLMYTTTDQVLRRQLLEKYQVAYVIIGDLERERYSETLANGSRHILLQEDLLRELGTVVFQDQNLMIMKLAERD